MLCTGAYCEHLLVLVTQLLQRHFDWQENGMEVGMHGVHKDKTMCAW